MHHLVYTSAASVLLTEEELRHQLSRWRATNASLGVTGVLLYSEGDILQVLEGAADAVRPLFATIAADVRHRSVAKLADGPVPARTFADWSMQLQAVDPAEFTSFLQHLDANCDRAQGLAPLFEAFMSPRS